MTLSKASPKECFIKNEKYVNKYKNKIFSNII